MWWIPVLVFVVAFGAGVVAAARWLPELDAGPVGGLAFFAVCGLVGAALGIAGLHVYLILRELNDASEGAGLFGNKGYLLAEGLVTLLFESGLVFAGAAVTFLIAPRNRRTPGEQAATRDPIA